MSEPDVRDAQIELLRDEVGRLAAELEASRKAEEATAAALHRALGVQVAIPPPDETGRGVFGRRVGDIMERYGLGVRAAKALLRTGAQGLEQIAGWTKEDLMTLKNCGGATVRELAVALNKRGLSFRESV